jgi:hypothetical protein
MCHSVESVVRVTHLQIAREILLALIIYLNRLSSLT